MTATYNPGASGADNVRMLIPDTDTTAAVFSDAEIAAFLSLEDGNVRRAAADAVETVAANLSVLDRVEAGPLKMESAKGATALLARAESLRKQADEAEARGEDGAFDVAEQVLDVFSARDRIWKQALRRQL